jgi:predicted NAD/FAD-binding protein
MDGATLLGQSLYRQAIQQSQAGGQAAGATESKGPKVLLAGAYLHHGFHEDGMNRCTFIDVIFFFLE